MGLVAPQTVTLLQTGDLSQGQFNFERHIAHLLINLSRSVD